MKSPVIICAALCLALIGCSTVGSYDAARLTEYQSEVVAASMTSELQRYPTSAVAPSGKPLFDAFADDLEAKGWDLQRSARREIRGSAWQKDYLRVIASKSSSTGVMVSMKTPYFDVHQGFETDSSGEIHPVTNPTLYLKNYEQ